MDGQTGDEQAEEKPDRQKDKGEVRKLDRQKWSI